MNNDFKVNDFVYYYDKEGGTVPSKVLRVTNKFLIITTNDGQRRVIKSKCQLQSDWYKERV
jgi:hypothetical protein